MCNEFVVSNTSALIKIYWPVLKVLHLIISIYFNLILYEIHTYLYIECICTCTFCIKGAKFCLLAMQLKNSDSEYLSQIKKSVFLAFDFNLLQLRIWIQSFTTVLKIPLKLSTEDVLLTLSINCKMSVAVLIYVNWTFHLLSSSFIFCYLCG